MHCIKSSAAWCTGGLRDLIHHICGQQEVDPRWKQVFFVFFNPNKPELLKAIWKCRGQVGRLIAFHFSSPTFKQGNNIKVSWFYHEAYFSLVFALFKLVLAWHASSFSSSIYYRNHCWVRMISRPLYLPELQSPSALYNCHQDYYNLLSMLLFPKFPNPLVVSFAMVHYNVFIWFGTSLYIWVW